MRTARSSPYGEEALSGRGVTLTETPPGQRPAPRGEQNDWAR